MVLFCIAAGIGLTILFHFLTIAIYPNIVVLLSTIKNKRKSNQIYHAPPTNAESKDVVRPSPDLLYSGCPFHITDKPLRITSPVPLHTYFSISAYGDNADNFFVINDQKINTSNVDVVFKRKEISYQKSGDEIVVDVPSSRGVIFIRTLVKDPNDMETLIAAQHHAQCCLVN